MVVFLLWGQAIFDTPLSFDSKVNLKRIATIGPVSSSFGKSDYIEMTVQVECKNEKMKESVTRSERRLNNKIMIMLDKPENEQRVLARDFEALK